MGGFGGFLMVQILLLDTLHFYLFKIQYFLVHLMYAAENNNKGRFNVLQCTLMKNIEVF